MTGRPAALAAACLVALAAPARAHVLLASPVSRYGSEMKFPPCGRAAGVRTDRVTTARPGETITVVFDEIIDHPGYYRIAFDPGGDGALGPPTWNGSDLVNPPGVAVLADRIPDAPPPALTHGVVQVQLPDMECQACTLQLIQVMTEVPGSPSFYYQCADLVLSRTGPTGGPAPGGTPAPPTSGGCTSAGGVPAGWVLLLALLGRGALWRPRTAPDGAAGVREG